MRREDREITDCLEIESILHKTNVCRTGLACADENPILCPSVLGMKTGRFIFIQRGQGKNPDAYKNSRCCFGGDQCHNIIRNERPCAGGMCYRSVIGFSRASFIEYDEEKKKGLNCIMLHYRDETYQFSYEDVRNVCVIRIDIDSMTGKNTIEDRFFDQRWLRFTRRTILSPIFWAF